MSHEIRWGGDPEDLTVVFSGVVSTAELLGVFDEIRAAPSYHGSLRIIQDHRATDWSGVTSEEIRRRAEAIVTATRPAEQHRVAVVVDRKLGFGLMRMREAHIAGRVATTDGVFYDLESARAWLQDGS